MVPTEWRELSEQFHSVKKEPQTTACGVIYKDKYQQIFFTITNLQKHKLQNCGLNVLVKKIWT
jgi:hypothetical protein